MFSNKLRKFRELKPAVQHRLTIAAIVGVFAAIAALTFFMTPFNSSKKPVDINVGPQKATLGTDNKILEKTMTAKTGEQEKEIDELKKQISALQVGQAPNISATPGTYDKALAQQAQEFHSQGQNTPDSMQNFNSGTGTLSKQTPFIKPTRKAPPLPPLPAPPDTGHGHLSTPPADYRIASPDPPKAPAVEKIGDIGHAENSAYKPTKADGEKAAAEPAKKKEKATVYLPPSFMEATLLSGLLAPTTEGAKGNPVPVIIRVKAPAVLPSGVRANLKGCFVIGEGVGSLADERAHCRLVSLACISRNGQAIIDQDITGFIQDADGNPGLAGKVVAKFGANVARVALAGLAGGIGDAANATASTISTSALGQTQNLSSTNFGNIAVAGIGRGITNASKEIQKFYLDLANASMPVIEVLNGKQITLVVTKGVNLEIKNYKSVPWN